MNLFFPVFCLLSRYATKLTLDEVYASGIDIDGPFMSGLSSASKRSADLTENLSQFSRSEEDEQAVFLQLTSFEKSHRFCPHDEIPYWMSDKAKHIVSISSDADKNVLRMFNYQSEGVEFAVGQLSRFCVEGIWASLNTELLYLTSDDDERYSIQVCNSKRLTILFAIVALEVSVIENIFITAQQIPSEEYLRSKCSDFRIPCL